MLICSPAEAYYRCRSRLPGPGEPFRLWELTALRIVAWLNALFGMGYVVLSEYLEKVVRSHGPRIKVHRVPMYGVDTCVFRPACNVTEKLAARAHRGLPASGKIIFFSSRIAPEKDVVGLLKAFRQLLDLEEDVWLLHRSGGHADFLVLAESLGIQRRLIVTDAVYPGSDLAADYKASDLCVQSSHKEGLGFSVLEALACEIPVVATATGGLRETIIHGQTGWSYAPGRTDELVACILEALRSPDEAKRRAKVGRKLVEDVYERGVVFERFANLVRERLSGS